MSIKTAYAGDPRLVFEAGALGVFDDYRLAAVKLGYEFNQVAHYWDVRPKVQLLVTDTEAYHLALGAIKEFPINEKWQWGISFSAGYFHEDNKKDEQDLDYDIEFYSAFTLSYMLEKQGSIRAEFGHISNSGFGDNNPGSESFFIGYVIKL